VHLPPSPFEAWFWSLAHTAEDVRRTLVAAEEALGAVAPTSRAGSTKGDSASTSGGPRARR
jgi:hypothetical protein